MDYNVSNGVTSLQVRNATSQVVIPSTTSVNNSIASVSVNLTQNVSIVVVALDNSVGRVSEASVVQDLTYTNFSQFLSFNGTTIKYTGSAEYVPTSTPLFIEANLRGMPEWFAVVNQSLKNVVRNYSTTTSVGSISGNHIPFKPPRETEPVWWFNIVTTLMTDMSDLFNYRTTFNEWIDTWDTSAVTTMYGMFFASAFNRPIGGWNTAAVTDMNSMFANGVFNQPIGSWNTANVNDMTAMFFCTPAFVQDVSGWVINTTNAGNTHTFARIATYTHSSNLTYSLVPPQFRNEYSLLGYDQPPPSS